MTLQETRWPLFAVTTGWPLRQAVARPIYDIPTQGMHVAEP